MSPRDPIRIGYVVKMYPRFSETFVVSEILAHEAAGCDLEVFSLRATTDTHFQDTIAQVRAPVHHLPTEDCKASTLWTALERVSAVAPRLWEALADTRGASALDIYQSVLLAEAVRQRGIEHLHAHFATAAATVARLAARIAEVPYTFTAHAKDIFHQAIDPEDLRRKLQDAHSVVTVSRFNVEYLREAYGSAAARVHCIYNGLDLRQFPFAPPLNRSGRLVAVGRFVEKKGFNDLITACALLAEQGHPVGCDLIGGGPLEADLRAQVEQLGLQESVRFLGLRPRNEVIQRVREAAAFVAPCVSAQDGDRDGLPTVLLEAMALGTPCVATEVTGIPEAVQHGATGLLVPERSPALLADAIHAVLADPELASRLAIQARQRIEADFDVHRSAARLRTLFQAPSARAEAA